MINSDFKEKLEFWKRKFEIDISFERHKGEEILDFQEQIYHKMKDFWRIHKCLNIKKHIEIDNNTYKFNFDIRTVIQYGDNYIVLLFIPFDKAEINNRMLTNILGFLKSYFTRDEYEK